MNDPAIVPDFVIGSVFDGAHVFFIRRQDLGAFWQIHQPCTVFMHTASFDLEVTHKACGFDFHPMIEAGMVRDISIDYRLLSCATTGEVPHKFSLALLTDELLGVRLDKDEAVRQDFGRFYHEGVVNYGTIPNSYLEYAARDAIATYQLEGLLEPECRATHVRHTPLPQVGITSTAGMSAPAWGWLGHDIQLRGDIALRAIEHFGIGVDPVAVSAAYLKPSRLGGTPPSVSEITPPSWV